ncbi:Garnet [Strongyloides ratti]|uniref:AP-3 complex subunit delta n=1 Tax=Strongyloides ratti TaxID=34506 RepID=A0A090LMG3_STRRB|nr:Garnet [Strongyloides ratti]CEF69373.1 Garnet [Strongyloides ratti]
MALTRIRSNFDHLFDKNLKDLVRGIRTNKENEAKYIAMCIEEIKQELKQPDTFVKANAIEKVAYLQMLGYDISWAAFNIVEVMASRTFCIKRIGYLAATQCFREQSDVLMLTTNMIRKDLQSSNMYHVGIALSGLSCFVTTDLARDLASDVVNLLTSSRPYIRKKAVLLLYKLFLKYPESLRPTFSILKERLEDDDAGVQSAAVNVICELARKNPKNYISLAPIFFKLMTTSSNNWMLIKIIKLFGALVPTEPKLGKKLLEPLTNLILSTSAMSLLYECINTVIAVLISISTGGPGDYTTSIQLCVQKLGVLIEDSDQNLKYLGLLAMGRILKTYPKAVQAHKDIVLRCLDDKDESIRLRALDLLYGMVSKKNIMEIVKKLMEHVDQAEGSFYRNELLSRIISICSYNNYQYISNFEWYISVLVELTKVEGANHGKLIAEQIQDVSVRVQSIRHFSVSQMALLVENGTLLLSGSGQQKNNISEVLYAAAWICGEYAEYLCDPYSVVESMLKTKISLMPGHILSVYVQNIGKLYSILIAQYEKENDWDSIETLNNLVLSKLPEFQISDHLEAQERACNLYEIVKFVEKEHEKKEKMGESLLSLYEGDLNPVAPKAQRKVPIPQGLNLDEWIGEPFPETEDEKSETESEPEPIAPGRNPIRSIEIESTESENEKIKSKKDSIKKRQQEIENNPYYVKNTQKKLDSQDVIKKPIYSTKKFDSYHQISELNSPLEIPGVLGMNKYIKQQENTLSWNDTKTQKNLSKGKKKKTKKSKKRVGEERLSVLSSSPSEVEDDVVVNHFVNRAEGEMPENAVSTDDEENINEEDNEIKALDIDLSEPIKENEKLKSIEPYNRQEPPKPAPLITSASVFIEKEEKKKKETVKQSSYDIIQSSSNATNTPIQQINGITNNLNSYEDIYHLLGENNSIKIVYQILPKKETFSDLTIGVIFKNKTMNPIEKINFSFMNTLNTILLPNQTNLLDYEDSFTIGSGLSKEYYYNFEIKDYTVSQKLRATFTYFVTIDERKMEEKMDVRLSFPSISFIIYRQIGTIAFENLLDTKNDSFESDTIKFMKNTLNFNDVINKLSSSKFFIVEKVEDKTASFYTILFSSRNSNEEIPICLLVKNNSSTISIDVKTNGRQLLHSLTSDIKDLFQETSFINHKNI